MGKAIPKYRRRSDGYAFVEHASIPTKTHRMTLGRYGSEESKAAYLKFLDGISGSPQIVRPGSKWVTIAQMSEAYLNYARQRYMRQDGLTSEYLGMVNALAALEQVSMLTGDKFGPKTLVAIRSQLAGDGYYRSTVNHILSRIKKFFRWCCENELCPADLYHRLMSVRGLVKGEEGCLEPDPVLPAPMESVAGVLPYLRPTVATMVQVQYRCGLRPGEVCRMGAEFIDQSNPTWLYYPEKHKNEWRGSTAVKAIPPSVQEMVAPYLENRPYFFPTGKSAKCYTSNGYRQAVERGFDAAKAKGVELKPFTPNQLRHAIATHVAQTLGHRAAQIWCGHDKPDTTALYIQTQAKELIQISTLLEASW